MICCLLLSKSTLGLQREWKGQSEIHFSIKVVGQISTDSFLHVCWIRSPQEALGQGQETWRLSETLVLGCAAYPPRLLGKHPGKGLSSVSVSSSLHSEHRLISRCLPALTHTVSLVTPWNVDGLVSYDNLVKNHKNNKAKVFKVCSDKWHWG